MLLLLLPPLAADAGVTLTQMLLPPSTQATASCYSHTHPWRHLGASATATAATPRDSHTHLWGHLEAATGQQDKQPRACLVRGREKGSAATAAAAVHLLQLLDQACLLG